MCKDGILSHDHLLCKHCSTRSPNIAGITRRPRLCFYYPLDVITASIQAEHSTSGRGAKPNGLERQRLPFAPLELLQGSRPSSTLATNEDYVVRGTSPAQSSHLDVIAVGKWVDWRNHRRLVSSLSNVRSRTFAPLAMSSGRENSFGEWLIPPTLGMKIIPIGAIGASSCASWPAPLGMNFVVNPRPFAVSSISFRIRSSVGAGTLESVSMNSKVVPVDLPIAAASSRVF